MHELPQKHGTRKIIFYNLKIIISLSNILRMVSFLYVECFHINDVPLLNRGRDSKHRTLGNNEFSPEILLPCHLSSSSNIDASCVISSSVSYFVSNYFQSTPLKLIARAIFQIPSQYTPGDEKRKSQVKS